MKDKILYLILGILIGAVITAGCFLVFSKNQQPWMRGERPDMSNMTEEDMENFRKNRPEDGMGAPDTNTVVSPSNDTVTE